ncbi:MAG: hypothetical protein C4320_06490, partial [Armatimonadota bacterium]
SHYAARLGRRYDAPNDGCLLGFACVMLTLIGGAIGLLTVGFPWYILTSAAGAVLMPGLACLIFARRMRVWRPDTSSYMEIPGKNTSYNSDNSPLD